MNAVFFAGPSPAHQSLDDPLEPLPNVLGGIWLCPSGFCSAVLLAGMLDQPQNPREGEGGGLSAKTLSIPAISHGVRRASKLQDFLRLVELSLPCCLPALIESPMSQFRRMESHGDGWESSPVL